LERTTLVREGREG